jgi:hypothetical protein
MILDTESWMNIRRFRALHAAGATFAEIGRESGCDWRTVRKYLAEDAAVPPAGPSRMGTQPLLITPFIPLVEAWLRADLRIKGTWCMSGWSPSTGSLATTSGSRCS